jgi:hypothetical protein
VAWNCACTWVFLFGPSCFDCNEGHSTTRHSIRPIHTQHLEIIHSHITFRVSEMSSEAAANAVWLRNVLRGSPFSSALCETKLLQRLSTMDKTTHLRRQGGSGREQLDSVLKLLTSISTKEDSSSQLQALPVHLTTTERQNLLERVTEVSLMRSASLRFEQCCWPWIGCCCHGVL